MRARLLAVREGSSPEKTHGEPATSIGTKPSNAPAQLVGLQRTIGNRATVDMLESRPAVQHVVVNSKNEEISSNTKENIRAVWQGSHGFGGFVNALHDGDQWTIDKLLDGPGSTLSEVLKQKLREIMAADSEAGGSTDDLDLQIMGEGTEKTTEAITTMEGTSSELPLPVAVIPTDVPMVEEVPAKLTIEGVKPGEKGQKQNKTKVLKVTLLGSGGGQMAKPVTFKTEQALRTLLTRYATGVELKHGTPLAAHYAVLPEISKHRDFAVAIADWNEEKAKLQEKKALEGGSSVGLPGKPPTQMTICGALLNLDKKKIKGNGHASVRMCKIALKKDFTLVINGQECLVNHLYSQPQQVGKPSGGEQKMEYRCYLGTDDGAYQRIHTSLEAMVAVDKKQLGEVVTSERAHTMLQTGTRVVVPGLDKKLASGQRAPRVGFDTKEKDKKLGLGPRDLAPRSKDQGDVADYLVGVDLSTVDTKERKEYEKTTIEFHKALDTVLAYVAREWRKMTATDVSPEFAVLDRQ